MDKDRQIRFLYPPIFLMGWLAIGIWGSIGTDATLDKLGTFLGQSSFGEVFAAIVVSGGIAVITCGFVIGTITMSILRAIFFCATRGQHGFEVWLPGHTLNDIKMIVGATDSTPTQDTACPHPHADDMTLWQRLRHCVSSKCLSKWCGCLWKGSSMNADELSAVVTFDHVVLKKPIHEWLRRRWSAFIISSNFIVAIILALLLSRHLPFSPTREWVIASVVLVFLFTWSAVAAWRGNMKMLEFQARRTCFKEGQKTQRDK